METDLDRQQIVELCRAVSDDLAVLVPGIVAQIRQELITYAGVPITEHENHVREQFRGLLTGLAVRRPPRRPSRPDVLASWAASVPVRAFPSRR